MRRIFKMSELSIKLHEHQIASTLYIVHTHEDYNIELGNL